MFVEETWRDLSCQCFEPVAWGDAARRARMSTRLRAGGGVLFGEDRSGGWRADRAAPLDRRDAARVEPVLHLCASGTVVVPLEWSSAEECVSFEGWIDSRNLLWGTAVRFFDPDAGRTGPREEASVVEVPCVRADGTLSVRDARSWIREAIRSCAHGEAVSFDDDEAWAHLRAHRNEGAARMGGSARRGLRARGG